MELICETIMEEVLGHGTAIKSFSTHYFTHYIMDWNKFYCFYVCFWSLLLLRFDVQFNFTEHKEKIPREFLLHKLSQRQKVKLANLILTHLSYIIHQQGAIWSSSSLSWLNLMCGFFACTIFWVSSALPLDIWGASLVFKPLHENGAFFFF